MKRKIPGILPVLLVFAMIGCGPATIVNKKMVAMNYKGTLADGTVFGQSDKDKPLEFMVGAGRMIPALEKGILGLKIGSKKTIEIKAADAYGEYDKAALQEVARSQFPKDLDLKVGQAYRVQSPQGPITVTVTSITPATVTIDFNHPLAGKDLTFAIEIVKIRDATKAELAEAFPEAARTPATPAAEPANQPAKK
jgi:FKBP-type peptidyl-prolyl cis-trans isomerase 2